MNLFQSKPIKYVFFFALVFGVVVLSVRFMKNSTFIAEKKKIANHLEVALSELISRYKNGEEELIDLSTITTFTWDRLYVYGPYTSPAQIDRQLGFAWRYTCSTEIADSESIALLIFTHNNRVVMCIEDSRGNGDFAMLDSLNSGISIDNATFVLDERENVVLAKEK